MKNNKGFTLIELLAVILILGIIALIAIPTVNSVIEQSRKGAAESTGNELVKALEQWHTICLINAEDGTTCNGNFKGNANNHGVNDTTTMKAELGIKGDIPEYNNITQVVLSEIGEAYVTYTQGNYTCTNIVDIGVKQKDKGVECSKN